MAKRAFAPQDKEDRRQSILTAAGQLFLAGHGELPSVAQIAISAALAKGTVYLYFRTKEEIYTALLLESWSGLLQEASIAFREAKGRRSEKVSAFIERYSRHLEKHPELLRLDAYGYSVLERNLESDRLRDYKMSFLERLTVTGLVVEEALRVPVGRGTQLLLRTYALTRGLWQFSYQPEEWEHQNVKAEYPATCPDFQTDLRESLAEYWRGALSTA